MLGGTHTYCSVKKQALKGYEGVRGSYGGSQEGRLCIPGLALYVENGILIAHLYSHLVETLHFTIGNECDDDITMFNKIRYFVPYIMGRFG